MILEQVITYQVSPKEDTPIKQYDSGGYIRSVGVAVITTNLIA